MNSQKKMNDLNKTIMYYDTNAKKFTEGTVSVDFGTMQNYFLNKLPADAAILDFGCGSGRDTKFFLTHGCNVEAIDGSAELCKIASDYTGIKVKRMFFHELAEIDKYDGIWACSSILHVPSQELADIIEKMTAALKDNGIIYTSFKYGTFEGFRNGRFFTDMTEDTFAAILNKVQQIEKEEQWITSDVRAGRGEEKWLNIILRKK